MTTKGFWVLYSCTCVRWEKHKSASSPLVWALSAGQLLQPMLLQQLPIDKRSLFSTSNDEGGQSIKQFHQIQCWRKLPPEHRFKISSRQFVRQEKDCILWDYVLCVMKNWTGYATKILLAIRHDMDVTTKSPLSSQRSMRCGINWSKAEYWTHPCLGPVQPP